MIAVANYSLLKSSGLSRVFFAYTFPALLLAIGAVLTYYIVYVFTPVPLYDARYVIPVAGMLLGNSMRRTIITLERFYSSIRQDIDGYSSYIAMGATVREAASPYIAEAYRAGLSPALAALTARLQEANETLWDLEETLRKCERDRDFGPGFIEAARAVVRTNDRRAAIKHRINEQLGAKWMEEKSYADD